MHGSSKMEGQQSFVGQVFALGHLGYFKPDAASAVVRRRAAQRRPAGGWSAAFLFPFGSQEQVESRLDNALFGICAFIPVNDAINLIGGWLWHRVPLSCRAVMLLVTHNRRGWV